MMPGDDALIQLGVIVGAIVHVTERAKAVGAISVADVIVVSANEDVLVFQFRVRAGQNRQNVAAAVKGEADMAVLVIEVNVVQVPVGR